jgi:hypothetical protein
VNCSTPSNLALLFRCPHPSRHRHIDRNKYQEEEEEEGVERRSRREEEVAGGTSSEMR